MVESDMTQLPHRMESGQVERVILCSEATGIEDLEVVSHTQGSNK